MTNDAPPPRSGDSLSPPQEIMCELRARGLAGANTAAIVLRGGRTNRVWRLDRAAHHNSVLKVFVPQAGNSLFPNEASAEVNALARLGPLGLSPTILSNGKTNGLCWVLYEHHDGPTWSHGVESVAETLGRLHGVRAYAPKRAAPGGSAQITAQGLDLLDDLKHLGKAQDLISAMPTAEVPECSAPRVVHGDPVPGNIVCGVGGLVLIDWQCLAFGDPSEDLAIFLSPAMQDIYRGRVLTPAEERGFLAAYPAPSVVQRYLELREWFHWRMACYCLYRINGGDDAYQAGLQLEAARLGVKDRPA